MKEKFKKITDHALTKKVLLDLKPQKSLWGILGVILFFIAPEIVAYFYANEIVAYAKESLSFEPSTIETYNYKILIELFEDGMSWLNLSIGIALLVWLFF
ncbi:hypothetical protein [Sulfurospirillum deleyianum]|uniref:Uncharacterized protein n=1 Tax=Sulfurospirillum deleyianum (strain ATCC 51133 / DSM 6946 / 5175) TaxID=525898 RepID=D1B1Y4_SULD5|nr:hypothetical protein [Sulfurospirillum deleyianum]ACZ12104.1 conserved hypothetical protein [Sulfurospirillum deleyianum DSM 6946]